MWQLFDSGVTESLGHMYEQGSTISGQAVLAFKCLLLVCCLVQCFFSFNLFFSFSFSFSFRHSFQFQFSFSFEHFQVLVSCILVLVIVSK